MWAVPVDSAIDPHVKPDQDDANRRQLGDEIQGDKSAVRSPSDISRSGIDEIELLAANQRVDVVPRQRVPRIDADAKALEFRHTFGETPPIIVNRDQGIGPRAEPPAVIDRDEAGLSFGEVQRRLRRAWSRRDDHHGLARPQRIPVRRWPLQ